MKKFIILPAIVFVFLGCKTSQVTSIPPVQSSIAVHGKLFTTVFQQTAAEYKALCFQAFNLARWRVDQYQALTNKPLAIITDVDETILDNSPYAAFQVTQQADYDMGTWFRWTDMASAETVPGAKSFLDYAASKGIRIYYITNREAREKGPTIQNLKKHQLPDADSMHVLTKEDRSAKEPRRQLVMQSHEVLLYLGDNLSDFSEMFDKKPATERSGLSELNQSAFGNRFILLPNPVYGDWETSLYRPGFTPAQKDSALRSVLKGY